MNLSELDARFLKYESESIRHYVETLEEADGIIFQCPKCSEGRKKGIYGRRRYFLGTHYIICWFSGKIPDETAPKGRWNPSGTDISDLTFVGPGAVSIQVIGGCGWHGFVKDGEAA